MSTDTHSAIQTPPFPASESSTLDYPRPGIAQAYVPFMPRLLAAVDHHRRVIFTAIIVLYLLSFTGRWHPEPDSALYLSLGRNLAEGHGYTYLGQANHLAYPGLPWLFAGLFKLLGPSAPFAAQLLMLAFALATLALTYQLLATHAGRPMAVLCTAMLGLCESFYRYGFELRNDMPFAAGVMAFLVGYQEHSRPEKRWWAWPLMAIGLAFAMVMRPTSWLLLPAIAFSIVWSFIRRRGRRQFLIVALLAITAIALFFVLDPRRSDGVVGSYEHFIRHSIADPGKTFSHIFHDNLPLLLGKNTCEALLSVHLVIGLREIVSIAILALGLLLIRQQILWGLWVLMIYATLAVVEPLPRYFLPILPLLIFACWSAVHRLNLRWHGPALDWLFVGLVAGVAAPNLFRITNDILFQHGIYTFSREHGYENESYLKLADLINRNTSQNATVIAPPGDGRILSYLTRRAVYPITDPLTARDLHGPVYIIDQTRLSDTDPDPRFAQFVSRFNLKLTELRTVDVPHYRRFTLYTANGAAPSQSP